MKISKLLITWKNFEKIFDDYDIFECSYNIDKFSGKNRREKIYKVYQKQDESKQEIKALSVCYKVNGKCLFLLSKDKDNDTKMKKFVEANRDFILDYKQITKGKAKESREIFFNKDDRSLIQLLFNSINMPIKEKYRYNNVNGKLYVPIKSASTVITEEKGYLSFIQLHLTSEMNLEFPLVTFKKNKKGAYVLDSDCNFRYSLGVIDNNLPHYKKHSEDEHRNCVSFLDCRNPDKSENTKMYVLSMFMDKIQEQFSEYFTADFLELPSASYRKQLDNYDKTGKYDVSFFRRHNQIYIHNLFPDDSEAIVISDRLKELFKEKCNLALIDTNKIVHGQLNIVIGHNKKFYKSEKVKDPYKDIHKNAIVQYLTIEDFDPNVSTGKNTDEEKFTTFNKIVNEIQVKLEIVDKTLFHVWQATNKEYTFVYHEVITKKVRDELTGEERNVPCDINFFRMKVTPKDEIVFSHFKLSDTDLVDNELDEEAIIVANYIAELEHKEKGYMQQGENNGTLHYGECVEGVFYSDINNINTIFRTQFHTLPNYNEIVHDVALSRNDTKIDIVKVIERIKKIKAKSVSPYNYDNLISQLQALGKEITYKELNEKGIFRVRGKVKWLKDVIDTVYKEDGILLALEARSDRLDEKYQLSNVSNIQYFERERAVYNAERNIKKNLPCLSYIAGKHKEKLTESMAVGCIIRDVIWQKECEFENVLKMLAVDFVRNDSYYTVLPFPFKYLHEYSKMIINHSIK